MKVEKAWGQVHFAIHLQPTAVMNLEQVPLIVRVCVFVWVCKGLWKNNNKQKPVYVYCLVYESIVHNHSIIQLLLAVLPWHYNQCVINIKYLNLVTIHIIWRKCKMWKLRISILVSQL